MSVFLVGSGKPGIGRPGRDVGGRDGDASGGPGSVVIATVPGVVRSQPVIAHKTISAAAVTRTCVLIC